MLERWFRGSTFMSAAMAHFRYDPAEAGLFLLFQRQLLTGGLVCGLSGILPRLPPLLLRAFSHRHRIARFEPQRPSKGTGKSRRSPVTNWRIIFTRVFNCLEKLRGPMPLAGHYGGGGRGNPVHLASALMTLNAGFDLLSFLNRRIPSDYPVAVRRIIFFWMAYCTSCALL